MEPSAARRSPARWPRVNADSAKVGVVTNAEALLQGRTAGVQIVKSNGEPGGNIQIRIRGGTSISASNEPLYVIDGVPVQNDSPTPDAAGVGFNAALPRNPLNGISPDDIETMTVLKDASATAIYGSRAANGVVLITTKRGTRESQIEYEVYAGASSPTKTLGLASGDQYRAFVTQFKDSLGGQTAVNALGGANTDWEKAVTHSSLAMNHNVAFSRRVQRHEIPRLAELLRPGGRGRQQCAQALPGSPERHARRGERPLPRRRQSHGVARGQPVLAQREWRRVQRRVVHQRGDLQPDLPDQLQREREAMHRNAPRTTMRTACRASSTRWHWCTRSKTSRR